MSSSACDVLVVGAGVAGLSACRVLSRAGLDVLCVEARDRVGGRILTVRDPLSPLPIELGPEFVHGRPSESWDLIRAGAQTVYDCAENAVHVVDGKVQKESDSWEQVQAVTDAMKDFAAGGGDLPFAEFIREADFSDEAKQLATSYVEGFNAAHKEDISVASLAFDAHAADRIDGSRNFRLASGYDLFLKVLKAGIDERHCRFNLSRVVAQVRWSRGQAEATVRSAFCDLVESIDSKRVVVTLPLGVLQASIGHRGAVEFLPLPERIMKAVLGLRFGNVMRVVMRFDHAWWEKKPDFTDAGFWLSQERYFPTWWTTLPMRSPLLVGWSAGPHADKLVGKSINWILESALQDLSKITDMPLPQLRASLQTVNVHDWQADPFSRGAYSYVPAGALGLREDLATPVEDTLFFAGEATETCGHSATVHGAIASGDRAARQVLESF